MKTLSLHRPRLGVLGSLLTLIFATSAHASLPVIDSIRVASTNIVVTATVSAGHASIILEGRDRFAAGTWTPLAVQRVDGQGGTITFQLPRTGEFGFLRVRADAALPLPASFYRGTNSFDVQMTSAMVYSVGDAGGPVPTTGGNSTDSREVVESDIWRLDGDTLYFFNQTRGLQVIDVTDPDASRLRGSLNLPAAGDQMYLLPGNHVILLTHPACGSYYGGPIDSGVLIVAANNGIPIIVTNLPVKGSITESRLVGTALYVASQTTRPVPGGDGSTWEWATHIASFDLAVPEAPVERSTLWYSGYGNVIQATDTYLFAVTTDPTKSQQSVVNVIDITNPDGTMIAREPIAVAGRVADKFKLDWTGGILSTISEVSASPRVTKLETFSLADPRSVPPIASHKLGEVEVGHGERLFATRFDGARAYIVTFLQIDPLWVVDLSDPAHPAVSGELQVPGWSTYIHPLGNRLVAVGVETNRTTVSLFDVSNPSHPALLSRVPLGGRYSYSEANWDEKAFNVLEDDGLILLPVQGYVTNGYLSWVQLIDLSTNSLTVRGFIPHDFAPRRATLHRDRILSFSAAELLSVDATDRDHPEVTGQLTLSWPVNRVVLAGNYLIEMSTVNIGSYQPNVFVAVTPVSDPASILTTLTLTDAPILGATVKGDRLYLAQATSTPWVNSTNTIWTNTLWMTVVDLSGLPELAVLGQTAATVSSPLPAWGGSLEAIWAKSNLLVWGGGGADFYGPWLWGANIIAGPTFAPYPYYGSRGGRLFAFDVSEGGAPVFRSEVDLTTNRWWNFSRPCAADGLVYLSHTTYVPTNTDGSSDVFWSPYCRSFLDVVDYGDPSAPSLRAPVNIPGSLNGISHNGALLYTIGFHRTSTNAYAGYQALDATAYDGVAAYLVDSLPIPDDSPHPVVVEGTNVYLARARALSVSNNIAPTLETWTLNGEGRFMMLGSITLSGYASDLVSFPGLLAAQISYSHVQVFDRSNPASLRQVGQGPSGSCFYFNLRNGDALPARDLWLPLEAYGVTRIPLSP